MRKVGEIMEELMALSDNEKTRMLIKELNNTCGSLIQDIKKDIYNAAIAESETVQGKDDEEYISMTALEQIIWTAGDRL